MQQAEPQKSLLMMLRIIWAAFLIGEGAFAVIVVYMLATGKFQPNHDLQSILFTISVVATVIAVPVTYFIRSQVYKRNWQEHAVSREGYFSANLIFLAVLEALAYFSLVTTLVVGKFFPMIVPALACAALQIINYPTGRLMQPDQIDTNFYRQP